jgi:hypothetical protein
MIMKKWYILGIVEYDTKKVWWFLVLNATFNNILVIYKKGEKTNMKFTKFPVCTTFSLS